MARTGFFHHIGSFLLFAATILILITCITAPVVRSLSLLKVNYSNEADESVTFGTFGYCMNNVGNGDCSRSQIGYSPAGVMSSLEGTQFSDSSRDSTRALTKAMILHPIACGISFIAFLLALGAGFVGSLLASIVSLVAFIVTAVILIIDFVLFSIVRSHVNDDSTKSHAEYGAGIWTLLAAAVCTLLATVVLFFTCCSARMHKKRERNVSKHEVDGYAPPTTRRRRFF